MTNSISSNYNSGTLTAGSVVGTGPTIRRINAAETGLVPGTYELDASGASFALDLADELGVWIFVDPDHTINPADADPAVNTVTLTNPAGADFTGVKADDTAFAVANMVVDRRGNKVTITRTASEADYNVTVVPVAASNDIQWATSGEKHEGSAGPFFASGTASTTPFTFENVGDGDKLLVVKTSASYDGVVDVHVGTTAGANDLADIDDIVPGNIGERVVLKGLTDGTTYHVTVLADGAADTARIEWCVVDPFRVVENDSSYANRYTHLIESGAIDLTTYTGGHAKITIESVGTTVVTYGRFNAPETITIEDGDTLDFNISAVKGYHLVDVDPVVNEPFGDAQVMVIAPVAEADRQHITVNNTNGNQFGISNYQFHLSDDPAVVGTLAGTAVTLQKGIAKDFYIVGPSTEGVTADGDIQHNGTVNAVHFRATFDGSAISYELVEVIRDHPGPGDYDTRSYASVSAAQDPANSPITEPEWEGRANFGLLFGGYSVSVPVADPVFVERRCYKAPPSNPQTLSGQGPGARGGVTVASLGAGPHQSYTATSDIVLTQFSGTLVGDVTVQWSTPNGSGSTSFTGLNNGGNVIPLNNTLLKAGETLEFTLVDDGGASLFHNVANDFFTPFLSGASGWEGVLSFLDAESEHEVNLYSVDGVDVFREVVNGELQPPASIPAVWNQVDCNQSDQQTIAHVFDGVTVDAAPPWEGLVSIGDQATSVISTGVDLNELDEVRVTFGRTNETWGKITVPFDPSEIDLGKLQGTLLPHFGDTYLSIANMTATQFEAGDIPFRSVTGQATFGFQVSRIEFKTRVSVESPVIEVQNVGTIVTTDTFQSLGDPNPLFTGEDFARLHIEYGDGTRDQFTFLDGLVKEERKGFEAYEIEAQVVSGQIQIRDLGTQSGISKAWYAHPLGVTRLPAPTNNTVTDTLPQFTAGGAAKTGFLTLADGRPYTVITDDAGTTEVVERVYDGAKYPFVEIEVVKDAAATAGVYLRSNTPGSGRQSQLRLSVVSAATDVANSGANTSLPVVLRELETEDTIKYLVNFTETAGNEHNELEIAPTGAELDLTITAATPPRTGSIGVVGVKLYSANPM